jgi:hypothetical protein
MPIAEITPKAHRLTLIRRFKGSGRNQAATPSRDEKINWIHSATRIPLFDVSA